MLIVCDLHATILNLADKQSKTRVKFVPRWHVTISVLALVLDQRLKPFVPRPLGSAGFRVRFLEPARRHFAAVPWTLARIRERGSPSEGNSNVNC